MKRNIAIALFGLASLVAASGAFAQDGSAEANVPFAFSVTNTTVPAGQYRITANSGNSILIRNLVQGTTVFSSVASPEQASYDRCQLVFQRYSERYFLRKILCPSKSISVNLPVTRREKRARMLEARGPVEDSVLVAMR